MECKSTILKKLSCLAGFSGVGFGLHKVVVLETRLGANGVEFWAACVLTSQNKKAGVNTFGV